MRDRADAGKDNRQDVIDNVRDGVGQIEEVADDPDERLQSRSRTSRGSFDERREPSCGSDPLRVAKPHGQGVGTQLVRAVAVVIPALWDT